jgi:hypothetical protein
MLPRASDFSPLSSKLCRGLMGAHGFLMRAESFMGGVLSEERLDIVGPETHCSLKHPLKANEHLNIFYRH